MEPRLSFLEAELGTASPAEIGSALLVVGAFLSDGKLVLTTSAAQIDAEYHRIISAHFERGLFDAKAGSTLFLTVSEDFPGGVAVLGLGEVDAFSAQIYRESLEKAVSAFSWAETQAYTALEWLPNSLKDKASARLFAAVTLNALTRRVTLKTKKDCKGTTKRILWVDARPSKKVQAGLDEGKAVAEGMRIMRGLADLPGNVCTPDYLAQSVRAAAADIPNLSVTVLDEKAIAEAGMGAFLSVAQGSVTPPRFIAMEYRGGEKDEAPVAFVGKGITFDAGGISLKPAANMADMTYDMSGAAAVIGTVTAAARAGLKINLLGVVAACENLPSGSAAKPGDVVTSLSGKTVEILNTDCEGRMILADALTWTARHQPQLMIDAATLTGACCIALGSPYSGLFTADEKLLTALSAAGLASLDEVWPMPIGPAYEKLMKSNAADIANQASTREGGASSAAAFLSVFTEGVPWAHLDIAATANTSGRDRTSTGRPVPLLMQLLFDRL